MGSGTKRFATSRKKRTIFWSNRLVASNHPTTSCRNRWSRAACKNASSRSIMIRIITRTVFFAEITCTNLPLVIIRIGIQPLHWWNSRRQHGISFVCTGKLIFRRWQTIKLVPRMLHHCFNSNSSFRPISAIYIRANPSVLYSIIHHYITGNQR